LEASKFMVLKLNLFNREIAIDTAIFGHMYYSVGRMNYRRELSYGIVLSHSIRGSLSGTPV